MKKITISSLTIGLLVILCLATNNNKTINPQLDEISSSEPNSKNTVNYLSVAKLKAIPLKKEYRIGELISIDFATLNTSKEPLSFLDPSEWTAISLKDSNGIEVDIPGGHYGLTAHEFITLESGDYDSGYVIYVIGCKDIGKGHAETWKSMEDDFENYRFSNWEYRCLPINKPGKYYMNALIENRDRKSTRLNSSHGGISRMPSSA